MGAQNKRFEGRHVVVTGAGTGIGRAVALRLAEEGASVSLMARRTELLEDAAAACRERGAPLTSVERCDVSDRGQVDAAFAAAAAALGPVHALVANAGVGGPNAPGGRDRFDILVQVNLVGAYSCLRAAQAHLAPGPEPRHLLAVSSILGRFGVPGYTGYCASKTGLLGLVRALAHELAPQRVLVNAVCPGWVDTQMARDGIEGIAKAAGTGYEEAFRGAMAEVPLGRMSTPEEVAGLVAWLLSPDAMGVTGQALDINGGAWMG